MTLKERIKRVKKNKDGKVLIENFVSLSFLQIAGYIFPLITIPYLARVIGVDKFGDLAFAGAIIGYFQTISDWGFNYTATRDIAKNRNNKDKISEIFSNVMWSRVILMILSFFILVALIIIIPKFHEISLLILITFLLVPGNIMFPQWLFQGLERMKYITILNLISKFLFTIAVFVFIKEKSDFILQPLLMSIGTGISGIFSMYIILVKWKIKLYKPSFFLIKQTIKGSTDVFINNLMPNLYNSFSILLLGFYGGSVANGKLNAGGKFATIGQQMMRIISRTFFPFLSRKIDKHQLFAKYSISLSIIISALLFIFAPFIIKLFFTPEFYDSIIVLRILSVSIIFLTLSSVYGTNYLIIQGYEKNLRNITIFVSLLGFFIAFPLVYYFSFVGAALTISITRGLLGFFIMLKALKIKNINKKY